MASLKTPAENIELVKSTYEICQSDRSPSSPPESATRAVGLGCLQRQLPSKKEAVVLQCQSKQALGQQGQQLDISPGLYSYNCPYGLGVGLLRVSVEVGQHP